MLDWHERTPGLPPAGLVATGPLARAVLRELGQRDAAALQGLSLVATRDMLVLLGDAGKLPWLDGVRYCAPEPDVPALWMPTHLQTALPPDLVLGAMQRRAPQARLLLWYAPQLALPLDGATPVDATLLAWLEQELD
ncbi:hypothetical protein ABT364_20930 [Massilia sp. SR12]